MCPGIYDNGMIKREGGDIWGAQSVRHLTLAHVTISGSLSSSPASGSVLTAPSLEPALDSVSPSFSLSLKSKHSKERKKTTGIQITQLTDTFLVKISVLGQGVPESAGAFLGRQGCAEYEQKRNEWVIIHWMKPSEVHTDVNKCRWREHLPYGRTPASCGCAVK